MERKVRASIIVRHDNLDLRRQSGMNVRLLVLDRPFEHSLTSEAMVGSVQAEEKDLRSEHGKPV